MTNSMQDAVKEMFSKGVEPVDITTDLYHRMMEILPPRDFWHDSFTSGEGGEIYLFKRRLNGAKVEPLIEHHLVENIAFTLCRNKGDKEFRVRDIFDTRDGSMLENPTIKFASAKEFIEFFPSLTPVHN
jgi:hypothetical protein